MSLLSLDEIKKMSESDAWTNAKGNVVRVNESKKKNADVVFERTWNNDQVKYFRESFKRKTGKDFADDKAFPVKEANFSWKKVAQQCGYPSVEVALKEADSSSTFVQVLRAGIQNIVNSMYQTVPTTFESWCKVIPSTKDTELYAPLHGVSFLREVGKQEIYGEARAAGLDIKLVNRKYGTLYAVEKELLEDDQTGQFAQQVGLLGEYCKLAIEAIVYAKLAGKFTGSAIAQYSDLYIPNTETQPDDETNYPFTSSSAPFVGGGYNRPTSFGLLTQPNIQSGFIGLMNQKNKLGLKMNVDPRRLLIGPFWRFDAAVLLNSSYYPSQVSSTAGTTGSAFAVNPIESIAALTISRFMFKNDGTVNGDSRAWYLIDDNKPCFVTQMRTGPVTEQENPNSGQSFDRDVTRFKVSERLNADWIDPRFCWQGNDGSVTS